MEYSRASCAWRTASTDTSANSAAMNAAQRATPTRGSKKSIAARARTLPRADVARSAAAEPSMLWTKCKSKGCRMGEGLFVAVLVSTSAKVPLAFSAATASSSQSSGASKS